MQYWANTVIYRMKRKEFGFLTWRKLNYWKWKDLNRSR